MSVSGPSSAHPSGYAANNAAHTMQPTWSGFCHSTTDALVILEACLQGRLNHIPRRPHDRERASLITSGNIFVYEENASGIKRWTDGMTWSPSRIMGNFLVYRELNPNNYPSGEKKVARKRKRSADLSSNDGSVTKSVSPSLTEEDRRLVGSLVDSYGFKPDGLVKRTLTLTYKNVNHHIISYYNVNDIKEGKLKRPEYDPVLAHIRPRAELLAIPFKNPLDTAEDLDPAAAISGNGSMAQMNAPQVHYGQQYAVQPFMPTYHPAPHQPSRVLHPIQTSYPSPSYVGSHPMHVSMNSHISNHSPASLSPTSHSPSPVGFSHPVTYDSSCQVRYTTKDTRHDSLWTAEPAHAFVTDDVLLESQQGTKRQKVEAPATSEALPPSTSSYYDCSPLTFDAAHYPVSSSMPMTTSASHEYATAHAYTTSIGHAGLSATSYDSYDYSKVGLQSPALSHGYDDHHDTYSVPTSWNSSVYQDLHHPITSITLT